ncbi:MAG: GTP cyclohydrolase I [Planctomycetota bacterium]|jgi:GTP cyclohydrolase I
MIAESCTAPATGRPDCRSGRAWADRPAFDTARRERAVREILLAIGEDPSRDGLWETPRRVAKAYTELFAGLREDPAEHLGRVVGLSKLARTVQVFARRPQLQERLTGQIADARMTTMARRGVLRSHASLSAEVLSMINGLHATKR